MKISTLSSVFLVQANLCTTYSAMSSSSQAITALQKAFPNNQTFLRGAPEFDELNNSYLSAIESDIVPAAIFRPKDKHGVSKFLQITQPYTCNGDVKFAVRGGG